VALKSIFSSATILSSDVFVNSLGLDPDKTAFIDVDEIPFKAKNRKIYIKKAGNMGYKSKDKTLPKLISIIQDIIFENRGVKGVIIPNSFWLTNAIYDGIKDTGIPIFYHNENRDDRNDAIEGYMRTKGEAILISTYIKEGFDFKDDLCRYLIIPKIPYPSMDDKIKKRMLLSQAWFLENNKDYCNPKIQSDGLCRNFSCSQPCQRWYIWKTALDVVQMTGRAVRHEEDYAKIYILDSAFGRFNYMASSMLPSWWKEALIYE